MGVKGLWENLRSNPGAQVTSLTDCIVNDAITRVRHGDHLPVIGVDASPWIYEAQGAVMAASRKRASWARTGQPAVLKCIFDRLLQLITLPASAVFVFDGDGRPQYKRGRQVKSKQHHLTRPFQDLIRAFGFHIHTAPGEAEAELAYLNRMGAIDYVLTSDADVFVFGASCVIRRPHNKQNYDEVEIYRIAKLQAHEPVRLSQAGLVFMATLGGGDYDPDGLKGFALDSAYQLAGHHKLVVDLWDAIKANDHTQLALWRQTLRSELASNSSGYLKSRRPLTASRVPNNFPDPVIVGHYVSPLTSKTTDDGHHIGASNWGTRLPNTAAITSLICSHWDWDWPKIYKTLRPTVYTGSCLRQILHPDLVAKKAMSECLDRRSLNRIQGQPVPRLDYLTFDVHKVDCAISGEFVPSMKAFMESRGLTRPPTSSYVLSAQLLIPAPVLQFRSMARATNKTSATGKSTPTQRTPVRKKPTSTQQNVELPSFDIMAAATNATARKVLAPNTVSRYSARLEEARQFLKAYSNGEKQDEEQRSAFSRASAFPDDEAVDEEPDDSTTTMDPEFPYALDGPPKECTPNAIAMFLWYKASVEGRKSGTIDQVYSAIKKHYDQLDGDKYRTGVWRYDERTNQWLGNPASTGKVQDMLKAIKNEGGEVERKHSRAMKLEDMQRLYSYLESITPSSECRDAESLAKRAEILQFSAFAALGFTLWTRNGEAVQLRAKNFDFSPPPKQASNGVTYPYFVVNLFNRKGWQRKMAKGENQLNGHTYNIYPKPYCPAIDMYQRLLGWKEFYEVELLGRPMEPEDHIFPTIGANLSVHPDDPLTSDAVQKKLNKFTHAAGLGPGYTTHCFRRGGAQYRFMFAPLGQRWTLARVRWWGGWAIGEHRDTLVRYLLDELYTYEDDHRDALCPFDEDASNSHMGEDRMLRPLTQLEGQQLFERLNSIESLCTMSQRSLNAAPFGGQPAAPIYNVYNVYNVANTALFASYQPYNYSCNPDPPPPPMHTIQPALIQTAPWASPTASYPLYTGPNPVPFNPTPVPFNPTDNSTQPRTLQTIQPHAAFTSSQMPYPAPPSSVSNGPRHRYTVPRIHPSSKELVWKQVIEDWTCPNPSRASEPMSKWDVSLLADGNQKQQYHIRKLIAEEYLNRFGSNDEAFTKAYPEHKTGMTALATAIRREHQKLGLAKRRSRKSRSPSLAP